MIIIKICQRGFSQAWPGLICDISDVMEYEPDADMIFNYLMVSALAAATDYVEKEGLKPSGGETEQSWHWDIHCKAQQTCISLMLFVVLCVMPLW